MQRAAGRGKLGSGRAQSTEEGVHQAQVSFPSQCPERCPPSSPAPQPACAAETRAREGGKQESHELPSSLKSKQRVKKEKEHPVGGHASRWRSLARQAGSGQAAGARPWLSRRPAPTPPRRPRSLPVRTAPGCRRARVRQGAPLPGGGRWEPENHRERSSTRDASATDSLLVGEPPSACRGHRAG